MAPHLDTVEALGRLAAGRFVPAQKYAALQRLGFIRVRGHGPGSKPSLTEAGRQKLADGRL
ncbi:hypothetical protein MMB17_07265 [Methylobacterium organophilum]|uniref:hypothetical protein n=1 Tax=Methylobacterium organophilum TaxID=410 RepID=UPI001F1343DF|nr:hypothetical protein [Methylobacterium organophilum]UMY19089.1 hypothetical protein MMB17_07265 [Methylobacterium organophilum]